MKRTVEMWTHPAVDAQDVDRGREATQARRVDAETDSRPSRRNAEVARVRRHVVQRAQGAAFMGGERCRRRGVPRNTTAWCAARPRAAAIGECVRGVHRATPVAPRGAADGRAPRDTERWRGESTRDSRCDVEGSPTRASRTQRRPAGERTRRPGRPWQGARRRNVPSDATSCTAPHGARPPRRRSRWRVPARREKRPSANRSNDAGRPWRQNRKSSAGPSATPLPAPR